MVETSYANIGVFSHGVSRVPHLNAFLSAERLVLWPTSRQARALDAIVGWGRKPNTARARAYAIRHHLPYVSIEDGFLRSLDLGVRGAPPLSLVVDDQGIYYDARRPSRLETLLNRPEAFDAAILARAEAAIGRILEARLSKYNAAPELPGGALPRDGRKRVLVVDQTYGDMSVTCGLSTESTPESMLNSALAEHPEAEICVKLHPDTLSGHKRGYLSQIELPGRVRLIEWDVNPISLLSRCDQVYCVSSQLGFEALMLGLPVTCFGMPFYAGWGATDDRVACPRRNRRRSVAEIFAAAYLRYARYIDPVSGTRCDLSRIIDHLAQARLHNEANSGTTVCFGVGRWKRSHLRPYLASTNGKLVFAHNVQDAEKKGVAPGCRIVVWGQRDPPGLEPFARKLGAPVGRVEDGFVRSVGLGSDLIRASSLVVDWRGLYYDPRQTSDLEELLRTATFSPQLVERAARLRRRILDARISKYNVGNGQGLEPPDAKGRRVILVPGQVEDDASVRLACPHIKTNHQFLQIVRGENPDAYIIYKPHPDVVTRNRKGEAVSREIRALCDEVAVDANIHDCLKRAQEVHTMTSLAGFEGLLRGRAVITYGAPFYAGWGLTEDRSELARRDRVLQLDELVAGVLILYPRYYDWKSGNLCDCETVIERLTEQRTEVGAKGPIDLMPGMDRQFRKARHLLEGWLLA